MCRAKKLIAGLGGEKSRWTAAAERLGREYVQLTGDVLLAAAQISYLGAFTSSYRTSCLAGWVAACAAKGVPCSERFKLAAVLGDPVKVGPVAFARRQRTNMRNAYNCQQYAGIHAQH